MTFPTKDEAKRAAEVLRYWRPTNDDHLQDLNRAYILLHAYATGELVERDEFQALKERVYGNCFDDTEDCGHCDYCTGDDLL